MSTLNKNWSHYNNSGVASASLTITSTGTLDANAINCKVNQAAPATNRTLLNLMPCMSGLSAGATYDLYVVGWVLDPAGTSYIREVIAGFTCTVGSVSPVTGFASSTTIAWKSGYGSDGNEARIKSRAAGNSVISIDINGAQYVTLVPTNASAGTISANPQWRFLQDD